MQHIKIILLTIVTGMLLISCQPDTTTNNDGESITTIKLSFKKTAKSYTYKVINNVVTKDTIFLNSSLSDTFNVEILDESTGTSKNLTSEIINEKNDHQIFYTPSNSLNLSTRYLDKDDKGYPLGIEMELTTGAKSSGSIDIVLKHQPNIKNGTISVGSTDLDVTFPVIIK